MTLENTTFTREHSGAEDKALGIKIKTARISGNRSEAIGMRSPASSSAWPALPASRLMSAYVTNRDCNLFVPTTSILSQLDDEIAIVEVDGKENVLRSRRTLCRASAICIGSTPPPRAFGRQIRDGRLFDRPAPLTSRPPRSRTAYLEITAGWQGNRQSSHHAYRRRALCAGASLP